MVNQAFNVLVVGLGLHGQSHFNNLKELEKEGILKVAAVVDSNPAKLSHPPLAEMANRCFTTIEEAYQQERTYNIALVVTNTATHEDVINKILNCCKTQFPALFVEKPLVENTAQAVATIQKLKGLGYDTFHPFTCGYLFRESPAVAAAINYIKKHSLTLESVESVWQKKRLPNRPSAGVHIDEATHPVDLLVNYLFPALNIPNGEISLKVLERASTKTIVDEAQQAKLYGPDHVPLATVRYEMTVGNIPIQAFSSFDTGPQRREIHLKFKEGATLTISCDENNCDIFSVKNSSSSDPIHQETFDKPNKLLREWRTFLDKCKNGNPSEKIPTLQDTLDDIRITEALGLQELHQVKVLSLPKIS